MILRDHLEGIPVSTCLLHVGWNLPEPLNVDDDDDVHKYYLNAAV